MKKFIEPKSDQLNGDDLIAGRRIIKITKVRVTETGTQDCTIWYEGDNGKPWKPCKSMGRVLVYAWGDNPQNYVGKYVELFRDPKALWAGQEVGGIRIWALSDIKEDMEVSLTVTRGNKKPFLVRKLKAPTPAADTTTATPPKDPDPAVKKAGDEAAAQGVTKYVAWRDGLAPEVRETIRHLNGEWSKIAKESDEKDAAATAAGA